MSNCPNCERLTAQRNDAWTNGLRLQAERGRLAAELSAALEQLRLAVPSGGQPIHKSDVPWYLTETYRLRAALDAAESWVPKHAPCRKEIDALLAGAAEETNDGETPKLKPCPCPGGYAQHKRDCPYCL